MLLNQDIGYGVS